MLDPIDGTKSFIHGVPLYTTIVAVLRDGNPVGEGGEPQLGVIHVPALQETVFAARGGGCWYQQPEARPRPTSVSTIEHLSEGLLVTTEIASFKCDRPTDATDVFLQLQDRALLLRTWGDAYGYLLVATGRAEAMIDPVVNLWDVAAIQPIIEEAGGKLTDWQGNCTVHTGDAIATNGLVMEDVLKVTRGR